MNRIIKHWPIKIIFLLFCLFLANYVIFNQQIAVWAYPGSENRNGDLLKDFLSVTGGLAVLAGLYLAFVRSRAIEETVKNQQEQIKNQSVEIGLTRDSNLNEQFKNAVEHLGSEREPIILGGVAELNQLALNQPDKFAQVVVNIYSSYCKSEAHYKKSEDDIKWSVIREIVTNLCHNPVYKSYRADLSYTNLFLISLNNVIIEGWDISYAKLPRKVQMVHFKNCNLDFTSGFLTRYRDVIFETCRLNRIYIEQGSWFYTTVKGNSDFSILAIDSEFRTMQVNNEILPSQFINCNMKHITFEEGMISSTNFICCQLERVTFRQSEMRSNKFDGSEMNKVLFKGRISSSTFRGVKKEIKLTSSINLYNRISSSLNIETNLSGISFQDTKDIDKSSLTEYDAYQISNLYNQIRENQGYSQNLKIIIPEEWKDAARHAIEIIDNPEKEK